MKMLWKNEIMSGNVMEMLEISWKSWKFGSENVWKFEIFLNSLFRTEKRDESGEFKRVKGGFQLKSYKYSTLQNSL